VHYFDSWIKIDQLDVTHFIISPFTAQNVSNVSTSISRCFSLHKDTTPTHIKPEQYNPWNKSTGSRKLLNMDVLVFETCWAVNGEIIKRVTSSWSIFIQRWATNYTLFYKLYLLLYYESGRRITIEDSTILECYDMFISTRAPTFDKS
jgi:hypothetical protein